jgi:hypothetical protein
MFSCIDCSKDFRLVILTSVVVVVVVEVKERLFDLFLFNKKQKRRIQATRQMHHRVGKVREQVIVCLKSQQGRSKTKCLAGSTYDILVYQIKVFYLFLIGKLRANIKKKNSY